MNGSAAPSAGASSNARRRRRRRPKKDGAGPSSPSTTTERPREQPDRGDPARASPASAPGSGARSDNGPSAEAQPRRSRRRRGGAKATGASDPAPEPVAARSSNPTASVGASTRGGAAKTAPSRVSAVPQRLHENARTSSTTMSEMTAEAFSTLAVSADTIRAVEEGMGYATMTRVQQQSIPVCLEGHDALVKARTGTGKTLSFLIPALEQLLKNPPPRSQIGVVVLSPTRELAQQIEEEAKLLLRFHRGMSVFSIVGGIPIRRDTAKIRQAVPSILVATPGRLKDLLDNHQWGRYLEQVRVVALDEADRLLDMGFRGIITDILGSLPPRETRQSFLFSATMPKDVQEIANLALRSSYRTIDTVGEEDQTHRHVPQELLVTPGRYAAAELLIRVRRLIATGAKIMVFFTATRVVEFYAEACRNAGVNVLSIHSRKSQSARNRASNAFRTAATGALFTSDVSARGMDYPDVSHVVQFGIPGASEDYVHRIGRTGRANADGATVLILSENERKVLKELRGFPLVGVSASPQEELDRVTEELKRAFGKIDKKQCGQAYAGWLGFHNSSLKRLGWSKEDVVRNANEWLIECCHREQVAVTKRAAGMMGLKGVPGLLVESGPQTNHRKRA